MTCSMSSLYFGDELYDLEIRFAGALTMVFQKDEIITESERSGWGTLYVKYEDELLNASKDFGWLGMFSMCAIGKI